MDRNTPPTQLTEKIGLGELSHLRRLPQCRLLGHEQSDREMQSRCLRRESFVQRRRQRQFHAAYRLDLVRSLEPLRAGQSRSQPTRSPEKLAIKWDRRLAREGLRGTRFDSSLQSEPAFETATFHRPVVQMMICATGDPEASLHELCDATRHLPERSHPKSPRILASDSLSLASFTLPAE